MAETKKALRAWARRQARMENARLSEDPQDVALALEGERLRAGAAPRKPMSLQARVTNRNH